MSMMSRTRFSGSATRLRGVVAPTSVPRNSCSMAAGAKDTREICSAAPKSLVLNGLSPGITYR